MQRLEGHELISLRGMPQAAPPTCGGGMQGGGSRYLTRRHLSSLETWGEGSVGIHISPNTVRQGWLMHPAVGCTAQGFASGTDKMGLVEAEVGKGGPCDVWAELPMGGP